MQQQLKKIEIKGTALLAETDYTALEDYSTSSSVAEKMRVYRQALRDITKNSNWPHLSDSDWPTKTFIGDIDGI